MYLRSVPALSATRRAPIDPNSPRERHWFIEKSIRSKDRQLELIPVSGYVAAKDSLLESEAYCSFSTITQSGFDVSRGLHSIMQTCESSPR